MQPTKTEENPPLPDIVADAYNRLKLLSLSQQVQAAEQLFDKADMLLYWEPLLKHTLLRKNCEITKLILKRVIFSRSYTYEELQKKVSTIVHAVAFEFAETTRFAQPVENFFDSDEFKKHSDQCMKVFDTASRILRSRTGKRIVSPSVFVATAAANSASG